MVKVIVCWSSEISRSLIRGMGDKSDVMRSTQEGQCMFGMSKVIRWPEAPWVMDMLADV